MKNKQEHSQKIKVRARGGMVDAADLKSVVRMDVPVQVRPGPPPLKHCFI